MVVDCGRWLLLVVCRSWLLCRCWLSVVGWSLAVVGCSWLTALFVRDVLSFVAVVVNAVLFAGCRLRLVVCGCCLLRCCLASSCVVRC